MTIRTATAASARQVGRATSASPVTRAYRAASHSSRTLWAAQGILAVVFLFAGVSKLVMSAETLTQDSAFSVEFFRFIGVCETLGAIGLVLPILLRIRPELVPLAAMGLGAIMFGAVISSAVALGIAAGAVPLVVGLACAFVAHGRLSRAS